MSRIARWCQVRWGSIEPSRSMKDGWSVQAGLGAPVFTATVQSDTDAYVGWESSGHTYPDRHTDPRGVRQDFIHDSQHRRIFTVSTDGTFEAITYDSGDRVVRRRNRNGHVTRYLCKGSPRGFFGFGFMLAC